MLDSPWFRLVNNWVHDFSSGLWGACVLVVYLLSARSSASETPSSPHWRGRRRLLVGAARVTGSDRRYGRGAARRTGAPPRRRTSCAAKRPALIGKHVAYLVIYAGGTAWAYSILDVMGAF